MSYNISNALSELAAKTKDLFNLNQVYNPVFYRLYQEEDKVQLSMLLQEDAGIQVFDAIESQLSELIKCRNPALNLNENQTKEAVLKCLNNQPVNEYGVWVYYPWSKKLIHLLDEKEFIELRTNRNKYKITDGERDILAQKKIGIIGLSVGQSVALTMAMERTCGELRLADFDKLELSNYNRVRSSLQNIETFKTLVAAREIAEIDPFLKVICFDEGITENNIDAFLTADGKLDLLVEECDSLDIKVFSREKAKEYGIPVLMDTNDRGMIDIERYDLQPQYPVLHGLIGPVEYSQLKGLTTPQKIPYLLKLVGLNSASKRAKVSLLELGQSINTWPQLASSVVLGGALATDISRRILLGHLNVSGRFYVDIDDIIKDGEDDIKKFAPAVEKKLSHEDINILLGNISLEVQPACFPSEEIISSMVNDAGLAPSSGNDQPWKWVYKKGRLFLFHDISRSYSFGDYRNMASYISLGASLENLVISAHFNQLEVKVDIFPLNDLRLVAKIDFVKTGDVEAENHAYDYLYQYINKRVTNRKITPRIEITDTEIAELKSVTESIDGAEVSFIQDQLKLKELGGIVSAVDRMRILHPHGHHDFFNREMRWTPAEAQAKRDGMDLQTLEIPPEAMMALQILSDADIANVIRDINGAQGFKQVSTKNAFTSSAMGLISMPGYTPLDFINGGRAMQRQWLKVTELGYAYQPLIAPLYLFPRIVFGNGEDLEPGMIKELYELRSKFLELFPGDPYRGEVFLFRIFKAEDVVKRSLRLPLKEILVFDHN